MKNDSIAKEKTKNYNSIYKRSTKGRFNQSRASAKNRKLTFTITLEEYEELIKRKCYYCNNDIEKAGSGLDRCDSSKGYEIGNVLTCCKSCNMIKCENFTVEETKVMINALKEYRRTNNG